ncbi:MAG: YheU family protein [Steroidobacteraceae bacterium]
MPDTEDNQSADDVSPDPVEVPFTALSRDALLGLVESFVLREGTDYGDQEFSHEQKVSQVLSQLESGEARILYDPETESVTLLPCR